MKVCLLTSNYPPEIHAGTEMVVAALAAALHRSGVEPLVLTTSEVVHEGTDVRAEEHRGVRVLRVFKRLDEWDQHGLHRPRLLAVTADILRRERPDLVHAHSLSGWGGGQLQQARALGVPSLLTFHDAWVTCPRYFRSPPEGIVCPTGAGRAPCVPCVNLALHHSDLEVVREALAGRDREVRAEVEAAASLTAPSTTAARLVREHLPWSGPIEVVPHGLLQRPAPSQAGAGPAPAGPAARPAGAPLRVGTFGNLVEHKGVLELVRAVAGLPCELHLSGRFLVESFAAEVRAAAGRLGVRLFCHGAYDPAGPHPARQLDLAVFPSRCQESYGLVVDEALAHGVPVVASDRGALAERAGTGGVIVTALPRLGAVLRELLADPARLAALRAAVPAGLPGVDEAAMRYLALYRAALAGRVP